MVMQLIRTKEEFDEMINKDHFILLKHSNTCPISSQAYDVFASFAEEHPEYPMVYLIIQENRELSNEVADTYHVKHESPQVILFKNGNVGYHTSHWDITKEALQKAIEEQ